jgi:Rrf2 family protein
MKITYKSDYALKAILELALSYGRGVTSIRNLAKGLDIPLKFLEQVFLDLKRGGFVKSRRGRMGGYFLAKSPSRIKLGEVIRFIEGPLGPIACLEREYKDCDDLYGCVFRKIWHQVAEATSAIIDKVSFRDLVKQVSGQKEAFMYQI